MDLKIRILSYQNAQNFGAVLQAFGLQQTLRSLGYTDVSFINYNPDYLRKRYLVFPSKWFLSKEKGIRMIISFYINLPFKILNRWRRNRRFAISRKNLLEQTPVQYRFYKDISEIECNALILGSDQIWSTWITGVPDPVFFGKGNYVNLKRVISYAPSTELSTFENDSTIKIIADYLNGIDCLSVREETVKEKLSALFGRNAQVCVDPTILCGKEVFDRISSKRKIENNYILVYSYNNGAKPIQDIILTIPELEKYEVHYISFGCSGLRETFSKYSHNEICIEDFISLFKYASYVVTNSFHGLVFSLLFNTKFAVAYEAGKSARCESLLSQIGCINKMILSKDDVDWEAFDYDYINKRMEELRNQSKEFLLNSLKSI